MKENLNDLARVLVPILLVILAIVFRAFIDANQKKGETERLYNMQPRCTKLNKKLGWSGRILKAMLLRR